MSEDVEGKVKIDEVPEGLELLPGGLGFTDSLQPIYRQVSDGTIKFWLLVSAQHSNTMVICHGGIHNS